MNDPVVLHDASLETGARRVLLVQPPLYDTRLYWSDFLQPVALLQLATALRRCGCDLRLLDALWVGQGEALKRQRVRQFHRDEVAVNYWRWGLPRGHLVQQLDSLKGAGWSPDDIYLLAEPAYQWEGSAEAVKLVRRAFPGSRVLIFGQYPTTATEHACAHSGADVLMVGQVKELAGLPLDLSLFPVRPRHSHLAIDTPERPIDDLISELRALAAPADRKARIAHLVFADQDVLARFPAQMQAVLEAARDERLGVTFHAFGGIAPGILARDAELAQLLFDAGLKQVIFTDDRDLPQTRESLAHHLDDCSAATGRCVAAGYRWRTDALVGSVCLGRPQDQERLKEVAANLTELAHIAGSVIVLPYQPDPSECPGELPLEERNDKLFPLAPPGTYRDFMELIGLGAILNAKYRSRTFDFLGDGLIPRLVRQSLITESWRPPASDAGRPVTVGWFGKDGKWVRPPQ
jgi:hypothetical protein